MKVRLAEADRLVAELRSTSATTRERAWHALYEQHYDRLYRHICRHGVEPGEVEDIAQRAFVVAFRRIGEVDDLRDAVAWLYGIAIRVIAQHRRWRRVREAKRWLLRDARLAEVAPVVTPERAAISAQQLDRVRAVLAQMSNKLREVLVLCDVEDFAPREAAAILSIPVNTVRSRRRLAREQFARLWGEREEAGR